MNRQRFSITVLSAACVVSAFVAAFLALRYVDRSEKVAECEELVMAADQMLIGAGQIVADANGTSPTAGRGLTRLQREAQLDVVADRYEKARDACLDAMS